MMPKTLKLQNTDPENYDITKFPYLKDFQHLSPKLFLKNDDTKQLWADHVKIESLTMMLVTEVMRGLKQFLYQGSLHGLKYVLEPTFKRGERFFWSIVVLISVAFCGASMNDLFKKWRTTPFVNVIDSLPTPIWAIPFPAVILCPQLHVKLSFAKISELDELNIFYASNVCPQLYTKNITKRFKHRLSPAENKDLMNFIIEAAPRCSEIIKSCYWRLTSEWDITDCCDELFDPVITDYGLCYAFNVMPLNGFRNDTLNWVRTFNPKADYFKLDWTMDDGYPKTIPPNPRILPHRAIASGELNGLVVELLLNMSEHQPECDLNGIGFDVLINSPAEHYYSHTILRVPMNKLTTVELSPINYKSGEDIRRIKPDVRQCFFQGEQELKYYEFYTDNNCKQDMIMQEVRKVCKCVQYNWPRLSEDEIICSTSDDFECVDENIEAVDKRLMLAYYLNVDENLKYKNKMQNSNSCYLSCNDIVYENKVLYSDLFNDKHMQGDSDEMLTRLDIHYFDDLFVGYHRHAQYDTYYFIGAIGGLFSLFMGFSIISVVELVWFVILRPVQRTVLEAFRRLLFKFKN